MIIASIVNNNPLNANADELSISSNLFMSLWNCNRMYDETMLKSTCITEPMSICKILIIQWTINCTRKMFSDSKINIQTLRNVRISRNKLCSAIYVHKWYCFVSGGIRIKTWQLFFNSIQSLKKKKKLRQNKRNLRRADWNGAPNKDSKNMCILLTERY